MQHVEAKVEFDREAFFGGVASGRWATERWMEALREGRPMSPAELRTLDTLRRDEWEFLDDALVNEGVIRLAGIGDLIEANLTENVPNAMGKTLFTYERVGQMDEAEISLDGITRSDKDRVTFDTASVPLPIVHKDFDIKLRALEASRARGEALDTTHVREAGRVVVERTERMLFQGGPSFVGHSIYGYTTHPNRVTGTYSNGHWDDGVASGSDIFNDVVSAKKGLKANKKFGPYWLYVPANFDDRLDEDYSPGTSDIRTIRARLLEISGLERIRVSDQLPNDNVVLVQATRDVVVLADGESLQDVQWDIYGGFAVAMKAFQIQIPIVKETKSGATGVFHLS